ncbi:MAG: efflux RND transporter permease subunit, partial [Myxococcota bacterium]
RGARDPVPLVIRSPDGVQTSVGEANATTIRARGAREAPLAAVADDQMALGPAMIVRRDRARTVTVSAELANRAVPPLEAAVARLKEQVPSTVTVSLAGERKGSSDANEALFRAMPLGLGLLLLLLLMEFDSFRRLGIVLVTVPLAAAGVLPGLLLGGQPFGFMSLLGVIALVGIVVNNAIVLIDLVEVRRRGGDGVPDAVAAAVRQRMRPILLTTCTTVAGMLPLALSPSPLWPPLAWAMISGLVASTALTLIAVPALYCVLFGERRAPAMAAGAAALVALAALVPGEAGAVTLEEAMEEGAASPIVEAAFADAAKVRAQRQTAFREALAPRAVADAAVVQRDDTVALELEPVPGLSVQIPLFPEQRTTASAKVVQPLVLPARLGQSSAAVALTRAADANARRARRVGALNAADAWLAVHEVRAQRRATAALVASLTTLEASVRARHEAQLLVQSDLLRVQVALLEARQQAAELDVQERLAKLALGRAMGRTELVEPSRELPPLELPERPALLRPRHDIQALEDQIDAARRSRRALRLDALPNVQAFASYNVLLQDNIVDNDWLEVGLQMRWTPLTGGARQSRIAAATHQVASLEARLEDLELAVDLDKARALSRLELARSEVVVREQAVEQAEAVRRQLHARYDVGSTTLSDLLEAEADLAAQLAKAAGARIAVTRARLDYREAHGLPVIEGD